MEQRMWDNVVMFSFHEIYPISFVNKFNFVNYITRNSPCIIHALFVVSRLSTQLELTWFVRT
jgi:hypothetical protein